MRVILRVVLAIAFCFSVTAAVADSADFVLGSQALGIVGSFLKQHPDVAFSYHESHGQGQNDQGRFDECNRAISRDLDDYSRQRALDGCMGRENWHGSRQRDDPLRLQPGESTASFQSSKIYCDAAAAGHGELSASDREDFKRNCMDEQRQMFH